MDNKVDQTYDADMLYLIAGHVSSRNNWQQSWADREDMVQEIVTVLLENADAINAASRPLAYMYQIALNTGRSMYIKYKYEQSFEKESVDFLLEDVPYERMVDAEQIIEKLKESDSRGWVMQYFGIDTQQQNLREISEREGVSTSAVYKYIKGRLHV